MELHQCYLTKNDCYQRNLRELALPASDRNPAYAQYYSGPQGVMIHSTGANNPWLKRYVQPDDGLLGDNQYDNDWNRSGLSVCVHAFVGKLRDGSIASYQTLPWNYRSWHCGKSGNNTHISIEVCEDGLEDPVYFAAVCREAAELTAHLCKIYGFDPLADGVVLDHAEGSALGIASAHGDISHWLRRYDKTMADFRREVDRIMKEEIDMTKSDVQAMVAEAVEAAVGKHYTTLGEVTQPSYRPWLDKLIASGYLKGRSGEGDELVIDLYEADIRALVIQARALEAAGLL